MIKKLFVILLAFIQVAQAGPSRSFNGTNNDISVSGFSLANGSPVTICMWVLTSGSTASSGFSVGNNANPNRCQAHLPFSDNQLYWDYGDTTVNGRVFTDFTPYLNKWTHVALVSSGSGNTIRGIYINGVLIVSIGASDAPTSLTGLTIGSFQATRYFAGQMTDFRIYNAVLSANQIKEIYGGSLNTARTNLVYQCSLMEPGANPSFRDLSSGGKSGINNGSTEGTSGPRVFTGGF